MLASISADGCHGLDWLVRKGLVKTKFDGYMKYFVSKNGFHYILPGAPITENRELHVHSFRPPQ